MSQEDQAPKGDTHRDGHGIVFLPLIVFALAFLIYLPTLTSTWVHDDIRIVRDNPIVQELSPKRIFASDYWAPYRTRGLYRPLSILSLGLNRSVLGKDPVGYHLVNAFLHALVSALVALLAWRLGADRLASCLAGLIFAAHPVHIEAVSPVVGRSELLAALFVLLCLVFSFPCNRQRFEVLWHAVAGLCLLLALLSKENAVAGLLIVFAIAAFRNRG
ncbi:phospholipid carrier-dependent glycosyltransferase, partial [Acidobacteriota bacterium]